MTSIESHIKEIGETLSVTYHQRELTLAYVFDDWQKLWVLLCIHTETQIVKRGSPSDDSKVKIARVSHSLTVKNILIFLMLMLDPGRVGRRGAVEQIKVMICMVRLSLSLQRNALLSCIILFSLLHPCSNTAPSQRLRKSRIIQPTMNLNEERHQTWHVFSQHLG